MSRRTATTVTEIRIPLTVANQTGGQLGTVAAFYSTPKYTVAYTSEPITLFGQLPLGSTLRGFAFIYPTEFGDVTFFEGPATGAQDETIHLYGMRLRDVSGSNFYELGLTSGDGEFTGHSRTLTFGAATSRGPLSLIAEGAWQERSGGDGSPEGLGGQVQIADGSQSGGGDAVLTLRHLPDQFVAYGAGEIYGDNYVDGNLQRSTGTADFNFDASWERIGSSPTQSSINRQVSLFYGGSMFKSGAFGVNLQQQATITPASDGVSATSLLTNQAGLQTSFTVDGLQSSFLTQLSRSVDDPGGVQSFRSLGAIFQRPYGRLELTGTLFSQRTTEDTMAPITQTLYGLGVARTFGKATIALTGSITHTIGASTDAVQRLPLLTVTRQISPVISAQASLGYQTLHDTLNPQSDGHSRIFSLQLNAPFSFGNALTTGRSDPRLPATILGRVQLAALGTGPVAGLVTSGASGGGLSNVEVILDDKYIQRTDLTGDFEFGFVTPGQHQLRIEGATIPRGLTVDQPVATITVQGGQSSQVTFQVGNFGGIIGKVLGVDEAGHPAPLGNVSLRLNGGRYATTDTTGTFGFGGLAPGSYSVEIIPNSIPAYASFPADALVQKVQVRDGGYTRITFNATPQGSISGTVLYGLEMLPDFKGGVPNVYVVAEPGEYAAIDGDDGSYIIDNLPPGDYTVSVDPETLPEDSGAKPESVLVHVGPGEHVEGTSFTVGRFQKKVVFSFLGSGAGSAVTTMRLLEHRLPPNGTTQVLVTAPATAKSVTVTSFNNTHVPLEYDKARKAWVGELEVPADAKEGDYPIDAVLGVGTAPAGVILTVDPKMPLAIIQYKPANPAKGEVVQVRARFLVDAHEGDKIAWEDGQTTVLGKPVSGRVFTFDLRISLRPMHGALLTKRGSLPIELL